MIELFIWIAIAVVVISATLSISVFLTAFMVEKELDQFDKEN